MVPTLSRWERLKAGDRARFQGAYPFLGVEAEEQTSLFSLLEAAIFHPDLLHANTAQA